MADFEKFCDYYAANFHQLKEADGLAFWRAFVEDADRGILKKAMDELSDQYVHRQLAGKRPQSPKLAAFRAVYFRNYKKSRPVRVGCGKCHWGQLFCVMNNQTGYVANPEQVEAMDPLSEGVFVCPCDCSAGGGGTAQNREFRERSFWELGDAQRYMADAAAIFGALGHDEQKRVIASHQVDESSRYGVADLPDDDPNFGRWG